MLITFYPWVTWPCNDPFKVGFMNDGRILTMDINTYLNGGCTLDESILVSGL